MSERGLGSRLMGAIKGVLVGLVLLVISFPLLFWNEGRAVKRHRDLQEGAGAVVGIDAAQVDPSHEGQLVHLAGRAETDAVLSDPAFGVAENAIHLTRHSEMYQWVEHEESRTEKQLGGSEKTVTTYTYTQEWDDTHHDSAGFHEPSGHQNPASNPHPSRTWSADDVRLGAFRLSGALVDQVDDFAPLAPPEPPAGAAWHVSGGTIYVPASPGAEDAGPQLGDVRLRYEAARPADVSVIALQRGDSFAAWTGSEGSSVQRLDMGVRSADQMFASLENENRLLTWLLRGVGFAMMAIGLGLVFAPISVAADVVPFLGDLLRFGTMLFATTVAAALSLVTIAVGWVAYRPLVGVPLLVLGIAALATLLWAGRTRRERTPAATAGAPA